jgi:hypothetical protein
MTNVRSAMLAQAQWALAHEPSFHYAQDRPIPLDRFKAHTLPITTDCSGFVTCIAFAAGVKPDPNGQAYNGQGFTGTLLQHCEHITKHEAKAGDFIAYGPFPGEHVVMLLEDGTVTDPFVISHGQEAGPIKIRASTEAKAHAVPATYLRSTEQVSTRYVWDIRDGRNELIAKGVKHPVRWCLAHPKQFRKHGILSFRRRSIPL